MGNLSEKRIEEKIIWFANDNSHETIMFYKFMTWEQLELLWGAVNVDDNNYDGVDNDDGDVDEDDENDDDDDERLNHRSPSHPFKRLKLFMANKWSAFWLSPDSAICMNVSVRPYKTLLKLNWMVEKTVRDHSERIE